MGASPSPLDRLTDLERRVVKARLANPTAPLYEVGKAAKIKGDNRRRKEMVAQVLKRDRVKMALKNPPPTLDDKVKQHLDLADPAVAKKWLRDWYQRIVEDPKTSQGERTRALNAIADMTPGALAPKGVHHTASWTLEKFVEAAGGKPDDLPRTEDGDTEVTH